MKSEAIVSLRRAVEDKFGQPLKTASNFETLADAMKSRLSASTLKRIWEYNKDHNQFRPTTIDILARYAGFHDFDDFLKRSTLNSPDERVLYDATKIADRIKAVRSDRCVKAHDLFQRRRYEEAYALFDTEEVQAERQTLCENLTSSTDNIEILISELIIKAQLAWCCNWTKEEILKDIAAIYNEALPLAKAINNHYHLWEIYQEWAFKNVQTDNCEQALDLYEQALVQARILNLETPEAYVFTLTSSLCDIGMVLCMYGMYDRAESLLREALEYNDSTFVGLYVLINLGMVCFYTGRKEESADYYTSSLELVHELLKNDPENQEARFGHVLTLYHWGVLCEETDAAKAKKCYLQAQKLLKNNAAIPNVFYSKYRDMCEERLKNL